MPETRGEAVPVSADLSKLPDKQDENLNSVDYCGLSGWYWYCEEHDAHGVADSEDEATFVLDAHVEYHELHDGEGCPPRGLMVIFQRPADDEGAEKAPEGNRKALIAR